MFTVLLALSWTHWERTRHVLTHFSCERFHFCGRHMAANIDSVLVLHWITHFEVLGVQYSGLRSIVQVQVPRT